MGILAQEVYHGFGPPLAAKYLAKKHKIKIGREALRKLMMEAKLWAASAGSKMPVCGAGGVPEPLQQPPHLPFAALHLLGCLILSDLPFLHVSMPPAGLAESW